MDTGKIKFDEKGLVPAIAQDWQTGEVLMLAYMNAEAIEKTVSTGRAHYFSRSRNSLWLKGETSGHTQDVRAIYYDCDGDALLLKVKQTGAACHTGERSCFYRRLDPEGLPDTEAGPSIISELYKVICERKKASPETSYVASLYAGGTERILEKVKEESEEFIEASKSGGAKEMVHELADLFFHTVVALGEKDIPVERLYGELRRRFGISGIAEKRARTGGGKENE